jgi:hypothetical protein
MQALDNFIAPIPSFDGDIPILIIPILTQPPDDESISDPSARASASASKTRASKRKATANLTPQKKAKKVVGRSSSDIKINEPAPKAPALTPPSGPRQRIPIHRSKRYTHPDYFSFLLLSNLRTHVQSAPGHQPKPFYKECSSEQRAPKGGQTPKSSS